MAVPLHNLGSDSANRQHMFDPLPQFLAGLSWNWTALNPDSEESSRTPDSEQATPAHLVLDQNERKHQLMCAFLTILHFGRQVGSFCSVQCSN